MLKKPLILYVLKQIAVALKKLKEDLSDERQKKNERSQSKKTVLKNSKLNPQIQPTKSKDDDARRH